MTAVATRTPAAGGPAPDEPGTALLALGRLVPTERAEPGDARGTAAALLRRVADAVTLLPALPAPDPTDRYDVRALTVQWLVQVAPTSRRSYFVALADWLGWCDRTGLDPLRAKRADVDAWKSQMTAQRRGRRNVVTVVEPAANTVRKRLAALSSWYGYLQDGDVEIGNPARRVKRPPASRRSPFPALHADELSAFLGWLTRRAETEQTEAAWRDAAMLHLMFHTGLRISPVLTARIDDLGVESGHAVLHYVKKGGERDWVPLTEPVLRLLRRYWAVRAANAGVPVERLDGHLFVSTAHPYRPELAGGRPLRQAKAHAHLRTLARLAGLPSWERITLHSTRRTAGTIALANGATLAQVQDLLGHADPRTTRRYDDARHRLDTSPVHTIAAALAGRTPAGSTGGEVSPTRGSGP